LLVVVRLGQHLGAPLREPADAYAYCESHGIPVYEAQVVGYPKRMKDFEKRRRTGSQQDIEREIEELERRLAEVEEPPQE
jgi:hypothetical protein